MKEVPKAGAKGWRRLHIYTAAPQIQSGPCQYVYLIHVTAEAAHCQAQYCFCAFPEQQRSGACVLPSLLPCVSPCLPLQATPSGASVPPHAKPSGAYVPPHSKEGGAAGADKKKEDAPRFVENPNAAAMKNKVPLPRQNPTHEEQGAPASWGLFCVLPMKNPIHEEQGAPASSDLFCVCTCVTYGCVCNIRVLGLWVSIG
eukprot:1151201-Pelagomonas_calceolata.AAC.3